MKHTIETIAAALRGKPTIEECYEITRACESLRVERRTRLAEITPTYPGLPVSKQPAVYREAYCADPFGLKKEQEQLQGEIDYLDQLDFMCAEAREAALNERARVEIPKAVKRVPALVKSARAALQQLEEAIAAANADFAMIAEFDRVEGKRFPLDDDRLAELLELRNRLWQPLHLQVPNPVPPNPESPVAQAYPKSWARSFERRGAVGDTIKTIRAPINVDLTEIGAPTYR